MRRLAILLLTITVFGFGESGVFAQFGIAPLTANQEFNTVQSHDMLSAVVTPCATCLANCVGSQAKCARECQSVCPGAMELVERFSVHAPQTTSQEFRALQSHDMLSSGVTPCATCLANCVGSQAKCARECQSVCPGAMELVERFSVSTPQTTSSEFSTGQSYGMLSSGATPCATCLANCVGSQAKCGRECASVCTGDFRIAGDSTPLAMRSTNATVESTPLGCCNTRRPSRQRCFLGRFRN